MSRVIDAPIDPESVDGSFVPRRDAAVQVAHLDGEAILVDRLHGLHVLNPTASLLWVCFDGDVTLAELADEIATEMRVSSDVVLTDAIRVAQDFVVRGMLDDARALMPEAVDPPAPPDALQAREPGGPPRVLADPPNA
jgi:hypothetical protein